MSVPKAAEITNALPVMPTSKDVMRVPLDKPKPKVRSVRKSQDTFELAYIRNRYGRFSELEEFQAFVHADE